MSDVFTEVTRQGWGSRISGSITGVLFGFLLILVSAGVLFWNEGRAIKRLRTLEEGQGAVVSTKADTVAPNLEGKLVHVTAKATTNEELRDTLFGVRATGIKLAREVSMYQWKERKESKKEKNTGGSTTTTDKYYYDKAWCDHAIASTQFKQPEGHTNPPMPFTSETFAASEVRLGSYRLSPGLIAMIEGGKSLTVTEEAFRSAAGDVRSAFRREGAGLYKGAAPSNPAIGDIKVEFKVVEPQTVSLVARQTGQTFEPFSTKSGGTIELLQTGSHSADVMFQKAIDENATLTWILRLAGVVAMVFAFVLIFQPLSVLADVLPFLGNLVSMGTGLVAMILGLSLSFIAISFGWIFYRPYIGIPLLAVAIALPLLAMLRRRSPSAGSVR